MDDYQEPYHSPTYGTLDEQQTIRWLQRFVAQEPRAEYVLTIGTDSQPNGNGQVYLITAIVLHRRGYGGIYVWRRRRAGPFRSLGDRMLAETKRSVRLAKRLKRQSAFQQLMSLGFAIHIDIGHDGPSRDMIHALTTMVADEGYPAYIKPHASAASRVAHRHTCLPGPRPVLV